jgi:hypothetical protein
MDPDAWNVHVTASCPGWSEPAAPIVTGTPVTWLAGETRHGSLMIGDDWHSEHDTREEAETYARDMRSRGYPTWRAYAVVELPDGDGDEPAGVPAVVAPAPMPSDAARRLLAAVHGITPGELALNAGDEP